MQTSTDTAYAVGGPLGGRSLRLGHYLRVLYYDDGQTKHRYALSDDCAEVDGRIVPVYRYQAEAPAVASAPELSDFLDSKRA